MDGLPVGSLITGPQSFTGSTYATSLIKWSNYILGIAYVESLCSSKSQSLIEDDVSPFTMVTASHELGHR